jgi:hypothetical protein
MGGGGRGESLAVPKNAHRFTQPRAEVQCWFETQTVFVTRGTGHFDEATVRFYASHAEPALKAGRTITLYHHWLALTGYAPEAREWLLKWVGQWNAQLHSTHVLIKTPQVLMGATVVSMSLRRTIHTYDNESLFLAALRNATA